jgi:hypothetical protein
MKRCSLAAVLLVLFLASCNSERQPSRFVDTFDRPDTTSGLGEGWDMRGAYAGHFPLPAATDGFIKDGSYTYAGDSVVYAVQKLPGTIQTMSSVGKFRKIGTGADTTLAMAITANDLLVSDMVHFVANRSVWNLTVRRAGGAFEPVANGEFSPPLQFDQQYRFELEATDKTVTVKVPGAEITKDVSTAGLLGDHAFWEEYPISKPVGVVFDFDTVAATSLP